MIPNIKTSTQQERLAYVQEQWKCISNCEACGKCCLLRGKDAEMLYADYINGHKDYMDITLELRNKNL